MPDKIGILNDKYIAEVGHDLRDSKEFKDFTKKVFAFIKTEKSVTWRQLNEKFYYNAYWLTMAVELLNGKFVIVEAGKIPERINLKEKKCP